jgi:hypothetical protein
MNSPPIVHGAEPPAEANETLAMPALECPACRKQYSWKPELAGRKLKCKCGTAFTAPAADEPASDFDDLLTLQAAAPLAAAPLQPAAARLSKSPENHLTGPLYYRHDRCGTPNQMTAEAVTIVQNDPRNFRSGVTICGRCGVVPDRECTIEGTGENLRDFDRRMRRNKSWAYHLLMPAMLLVGFGIGAVAGMLYMGDWPGAVFGFAGSVILYHLTIAIRHALAMRGLLP